jgi:hypothetical protein
MFYVYDTARPRTRIFTQKFFDGLCNVIGPKNVEYKPIGTYREKGIPNDATGVASLGILRGTGLMFKEAASKGIPYYYLDHSYFDPGYNGKQWLRVCKNLHTMNFVKDADSYRWKMFFKGENKVQPWKTFEQRGEHILVCPPTHAISWYNDIPAPGWLDETLQKLKTMLHPDEHWRIKVRLKPNEPIVNKLGDLIRLEKHENQEPVPKLKNDLGQAQCVIAYNSMVALQATLDGIPVITTDQNCCWPVSFPMEVFDNNNIKPREFDQEPDRVKLVYWLSYNQFTATELENGYCYRQLEKNYAS